MKKIWHRKWLVLLGALTIFLSVGAVAWATTGDAVTTDTPAAGSGLGVTAAGNGLGVAAGNGLGVTAAGNGLGTAVAGTQCDGDCTQAGSLGGAMRRALREKGEQWMERHTKLMDSLRDDMTPADQALYDQLVQKAKDQREALQQARQNLADTLKQVRDLTDKYLDDQN